MDGKKIKAKLMLAGLKVDEFLAKVNSEGYIMDRNKYYRCLRGEDEFDRKEIKAICETLDLSDEEMVDIFFNEEVS